MTEPRVSAGAPELRDELVRTAPAPPAIPEREPHGRRRDIQGLRGMAVLLVVVFHSGLGLSGGFTGVDVFFVISDFVITTTLLKEATATGRISLARF